MKTKFVSKKIVNIIHGIQINTITLIIFHFLDISICTYGIIMNNDVQELIH